MISCEQFHEIAPDLALGLLAGGERAMAIGHLTTCVRCRQHLDGLVQVADELLALAPTTEPEIGFESRVIAKLAAAGAFQATTAAPPEPPVPPATAVVGATGATGAGASAVETSGATGTGAGVCASPMTSPEAIGAAANSTPPAAAPSSTPATTAPSSTTTPPSRSPTDAASAPRGHLVPLPSPPATRSPQPARGASQRWWTRPLTAAAAAVLVLAVGVAGWSAGLSRGRTQGRVAALRSAVRTESQLMARTVVVWADHGKSTCQLVAFPPSGRQPAHLVIHLEEPGAPPEVYEVFAVPAHGGPEVLVGAITVTDTEGTLTAAIPERAGPVDAVRVTEGAGTTKYWARFAAV